VVVARWYRVIDRGVCTGAGALAGRRVRGADEDGRGASSRGDGRVLRAGFGELLLAAPDGRLFPRACGARVVGVREPPRDRRCGADCPA